MSDHALNSTLWLNVCIHEVSEQTKPDCPWKVNNRSLDELLLDLQDKGWAATLPGRDEPTASRRLLLTVDDARAGAIHWLFNSAVAANISATIFPVPFFIDHIQDVPPSERYSDFATWEQLGEASQSGHRIGSHGLTHRALTELLPSELQEELGLSKRLLEEKFSLPVEDLALPYGFYNSQVLEASVRNGYKLVHSSEPGLIDPAQMRSGLLCRFLVCGRLPNLGLESRFLGDRADKS